MLTLGAASFLFYLLGLLIIGNMYDPPVPPHVTRDHTKSHSRNASPSRRLVLERLTGPPQDPNLHHHNASPRRRLLLHEEHRRPPPRGPALVERGGRLRQLAVGVREQRAGDEGGERDGLAVLLAGDVCAACCVGGHGDPGVRPAAVLVGAACWYVPCGLISPLDPFALAWSASRRPYKRVGGTLNMLTRPSHRAHPHGNEHARLLAVRQVQPGVEHGGLGVF